MKLTACVIFILLTLLTFVSSALLWSANHFFSIPEGILTPENRALFYSRQQLMTAWTAVDKIILRSAFLGFLLLLIMMAVSKHTVSLKQKLAYVPFCQQGYWVSPYCSLPLTQYTEHGITLPSPFL